MRQLTRHERIVRRAQIQTQSLATFALRLTARPIMFSDSAPMKEAKGLDGGTTPLDGAQIWRAGNRELFSCAGGGVFGLSARRHLSSSDSSRVVCRSPAATAVAPSGPRAQPLLVVAKRMCLAGERNAARQKLG